MKVTKWWGPVVRGRNVAATNDYYILLLISTMNNNNLFDGNVLMRFLDNDLNTVNVPAPYLAFHSNFQSEVMI